MRNWVRRALTKRVHKTARGTEVETAVPPSERLVLAVYVTIVATVGLTALEIVYMVVFKAWNSEIFSAITALVGLVVGTLIGAKSD